ncbi:MAG TPA: hypothetical protein VM510_15130, partial [Caulifigura sp.]|nr:hypothetical protein [Caulifigura sp.]
TKGAVYLRSRPGDWLAGFVFLRGPIFREIPSQIGPLRAYNTVWGDRSSRVGSLTCFRLRGFRWVFLGATGSG